MFPGATREIGFFTTGLISRGQPLQSGLTFLHYCYWEVASDEEEEGQAFPLDSLVLVVPGDEVDHGLINIGEEGLLSVTRVNTNLLALFKKL